MASIGSSYIGHLTVEKVAAEFCECEENGNPEWEGCEGVGDRAFYTGGSSWTDGGTAVSNLELGFGPYSASCNSSTVDGATTSGNTFEVCDPVTGFCYDYYKFYVISSKSNGEIRIKDEDIKYILPERIRDQFMDSPGLLGVGEHIMVKSIIDPGGTLPKNPNAGGSNYTGGVKYRRIEQTSYSCLIIEPTDELVCGEAPDPTDPTKVNAKDSPLYGAFSIGDLCHDQNDISPFGQTFDGRGNALSINFTPYDGAVKFIKIPVVDRSYPSNTY